jgi:hypothetical protein
MKVFEFLPHLLLLRSFDLPEMTLPAARRIFGDRSGCDKLS